MKRWRGLRLAEQRTWCDYDWRDGRPPPHPGTVDDPEAPGPNFYARPSAATAAAIFARFEHGLRPLALDLETAPIPRAPPSRAAPGTPPSRERAGRHGACGDATRAPSMRVGVPVAAPPPPDAPPPAVPPGCKVGPRVPLEPLEQRSLGPQARRNTWHPDSGLAADSDIIAGLDAAAGRPPSPDFSACSASNSSSGGYSGGASEPTTSGGTATSGSQQGGHEGGHRRSMSLGRVAGALACQRRAPPRPPML